MVSTKAFGPWTLAHNGTDIDTRTVGMGENYSATTWRPRCGRPPLTPEVSKALDSQEAGHGEVILFTIARNGWH